MGTELTSDAKSRLVDTLRELVAIDSTSALSNAKMIDAAKKLLGDLGAKFNQVEYTDDRGVHKANLIAVFGEGPLELCLVGHSDCVPYAADWADALALKDEGDRLIGRGANDTKAYIACAIEAARACASKMKKSFAVVLTADEEAGCVGAKKLVEHGGLKTKYAIIGEPTSLVPVRANKGYCLATVKIVGKEGHSAYPETGASAIHAAGLFIARTVEFSEGQLRQRRHPDFMPPFTTLNIGQISGGTAKNVIAGVCTFPLEWRPLPGDLPQDVERVLLALAEAVGAQTKTSIQLSFHREDAGFECAADAQIVTLMESLSGNKSTTVPFGTEGAHLTALGAEAVVFGPGDIRVAHQTGEFVPKAELYRCAEILTDAVLALCQ